VGAYGARTSKDPVDESWPTTGIPTSEYSRQKAEVERALDTFEARHRDVRVVRLRTSIVMRHSVGAEIDRLFLPSWLPRRLLTPDRLRVVPVPRGLALQVVHSDDAASAYAAAVFADERGAFNVAGAPTLDASTLATALDARAVEVAPAMMRTAVDVAFRSHLQPTPVGWFDLAAQVPILDTGRARRALGWAPEHDAGVTLRDALFGIAEHAGEPTAPLTADAGTR
jgi:nucleoside-diphosphate-sugar epimerase